jgi:hypothetical protein
VAFVEDRSVFFSDLDSVVAIYNGGGTVRGYLDLAYIEPLGNAVQGSAPVFTCNASDLPSIRQSDTLFFVVRGETYKVVGVEPDGTGILALRLERQ